MHFLSRQAVLRELHVTVALHLEADLPTMYVCFIENNAQIRSYCQRFKPYRTPIVCWYLPSFRDSCLLHLLPSCPGPPCSLASCWVGWWEPAGNRKDRGERGQGIYFPGLRLRSHGPAAFLYQRFQLLPGDVPKSSFSLGHHPLFLPPSPRLAMVPTVSCPGYCPSCFSVSCLCFTSGPSSNSA